MRSFRMRRVDRVKEGLEIGICAAGPVWDGIEATLRGRRLRVRRLGESLEEAAREIKMLYPHAVIFEMHEDEQAVISAILCVIPGVKLIGIDPGHDSITVFSASAQPVFSMENLALAIFGDEQVCDMSFQKGEKEKGE